ncbi:MAG TPA: MipA/OmpV family protein [Methylibium sp.]|uniref:MipA/OmpV family protein n=1 Tax=Methylibium sp. TaxID=2067992 RepID=UPI002DB96A38|nr:MipA/OmpV family protein [Methylibium sp.]HEU4458417.1 MipA/OmpV family protein [Methylibium sp.]
MTYPRCGFAALPQGGAPSGPAKPDPSRLPARPGKRALLVSVACAFVAWPAWCTEKPLWELGAGVGLLRLPHYAGSDQYHGYALPLPYLVYRGEIFKADRDGARAVLFESDRVDFDLSASASPPTRSEDNEARRGMADLKPTFELGPNLNLTLQRGANWKLDLRLPVRAVATVQSNPRFVGWNAQPNLNLDLARVGGSDWNLGVLGAASFATRRVHGRIYDVALVDALPDRPLYRAGGGYGGAHVTLAMSRRFESVWAGFYTRYDRIDGARFEASPLVRRKDNVSIGFAVSYVFATSRTMVDVADLP